MRYDAAWSISDAALRQLVHYALAKVASDAQSSKSNNLFNGIHVSQGPIQVDNFVDAFYRINANDRDVARDADFLHTWSDSFLATSVGDGLRLTRIPNEYSDVSKVYGAVFGNVIERVSEMLDDIHRGKKVTLPSLQSAVSPRSADDLKSLLSLADDIKFLRDVMDLRTLAEHGDTMFFDALLRASVGRPPLTPYTPKLLSPNSAREALKQLMITVGDKQLSVDDAYYFSVHQAFTRIATIRDPNARDTALQQFLDRMNGINVNQPTVFSAATAISSGVNKNTDEFKRHMMAMVRNEILQKAAAYRAALLSKYYDSETNARQAQMHTFNLALDLKDALKNDHNTEFGKWLASNFTFFAAPIGILMLAFGGSTPLMLGGIALLGIGGYSLWNTYSRLVDEQNRPYFYEFASRVVYNKQSPKEVIADMHNKYGKNVADLVNDYYHLMALGFSLQRLPPAKRALVEYSLLTRADVRLASEMQE